jgi:hypothetical protein
VCAKLLSVVRSSQRRPIEFRHILQAVMPECFADTLRRQLDEVAVVLAIHDDAVRDRAALEAAVDKAAAALDAHGDALLPAQAPLLSLAVQVLDEAPAADAAGEAIVSARCQLTVELRLPRDYLAADAPAPLLWSLACRPTLHQAERNEVMRALNEAAAALPGTESMAALLDAARSTLLDVKAQAAEEAVEEHGAQEAAAEAELLRLEAVLSKERTIGRRCVYFHHIWCTYKRRAIANWSRALRISGFCKIGYPGVLVVEGPECGVAELVRLLQRCRWKLMVVRGEEAETAAAGGDVDALRHIPRAHGVVEMCDASDIAERCRAADLEALFLTSMKIYR